MPEPLTLSQAFVAAASQLARGGGIDTPELDARLLLCHAAGAQPRGLYRPRPRCASSPRPPRGSTRPSPGASSMSRWRASPATREFYGRSFLVDPTSLDPRPDTETLIEAALAIVERQGWREQPLRLLDLGTGTGCILVTLLAELPRAQGIGTDISPGALALRRRQCRPARRRRSRRLHRRRLARRRLRPIRPDPLQPALHRLRRDRRARRRRGGLRPASRA